jgi:hypothetical protein
MEVTKIKLHPQKHPWERQFLPEQDIDISQLHPEGKKGGFL